MIPRLLSRPTLLCPRCSFAKAHSRPPWLPQRPAVAVAAQPLRTSAALRREQPPVKPSAILPKTKTTETPPSPTPKKPAAAASDPLAGVDKSAAEQRKVRLQVQMIFQNPYASLNPRMSVGEIVSEATYRELFRSLKRRGL